MSIKPKRVDIQLAEPFSESRLLNLGRYHTHWTPPYILQPKLNGERCRMLVGPAYSLLLSSTGEIISSVPHINKAGQSLPHGEYDGELYAHGLTWAEIHSIISTVTTVHPRAEELQLHIFDVINDELQITRLSQLLKLFGGPRIRGPLHLVEPHICFTLEEIYSVYSKYISLGYEGFIIRHIYSLYTRHRTGNMMKFKPKATDTYLITGVFEAISEGGIGKKMVGGFNCIDPEGTSFKVGAGKLTHQERTELWWQYLDSPSSIIGQTLEIEYQTMSDKKKVPLFSRALRIIPTLHSVT